MQLPMQVQQSKPVKCKFCTWTQYGFMGIGLGEHVAGKHKAEYEKIEQGRRDMVAKEKSFDLVVQDQEGEE